MAVNLIDSTDIEVTQTGENIQLSTTVDMQTLESNVSTNASNIENLQTYSTNEVNTGKIWINGKPIYRKVIDFGALPNNTSKQVNHNINNIDKVITMSGYSYTSSSVFYPLPLQFKGSDSNYNVEMSVTTTYVGMISNTNRSGFSAYVILEYTKTTD